MITRYTSYLLMLIFFCSFLPLTSEAQILNKLTRKLEDKIEKMGEEEIDKELSKEVDKDLGQDTTLREDTTHGGYDRTSKALLEGILGSSMNPENIELPEDYHFDMSVTYEMTNEKDKVSYIKYLLPSSGTKVIGFEMMDEDKKAENKIVWDLEREVMVMYQEDKKGNKSLQKLPSFTNVFSKQMEQENEEKYGETTIKKTGKTKTILGYSCDEYIMENDEMISNVWIADKFPYSYRDFADVFSQQMKTPGYSELSEKEGFALEMKTTYKNKKARTSELKAVDINDEGFSINNADYVNKK